MNATIVDRLLQGRDLSISESEDTFRRLFNLNQKDNALCQQILTLLAKKGECANELLGLVYAVRKIEKNLPKVRLPFLVDNCGTGGDGAHTFNISTISSFVAAGAGAYVAKHGNRGISSMCGSADLLKELGVKIDAPASYMLQALEECRIAYFHAPLYHPSFKRVQPLRSELARKKIKTIFNLAGPLLNPIMPTKQVIGVFQKRFVSIIAEAAKKLKLKHVLVVWNYDGTDELTTTNQSLLLEVRNGRVKAMHIPSTPYGLKAGKKRDLKGGNAKLNRTIALRILEGKDKGVKRDTILLNAGAILYVSGRANNLKEGIELARRSIESKRALNALKQLVQISHDSE